MSEDRDALLAAIDDLSEEELIALNQYAENQNKQFERDPMLKHGMDNEAQAALRAMTADYRVLNGANKTGKTDESAFICVAMCKNRTKEFGIYFPHKPPLKIWYCGRDRNVLSDAPLDALQRYLKGEGIDHKIYRSGNTVLKMEIWDDELPKEKQKISEVIFKPYTGEKKIWESANVHACFMDEEPPRHVFNAVKTKIAFKPGIVFITMTPDDGISWTFDLFNGHDPDHGRLLEDGQMEMYECTVFDNMRHFPVINGYDWVRWPSEYGYEEKAWGTYRDNPENGYREILAPDVFARYLKKSAYGSNEYEMRILGRFTSFAGRVYPFNYENNIFRLKELPSFDNLLFFGSLDYGYAPDPASFSLWAVSKAGVHYNLGGFYETKLTAPEQAQKIKEICDWWGVRPIEIVADNQINANTGIQNKVTKEVIRIVDQYYEVLGTEWTYFRTEKSDKDDAVSKRDRAIQMFKDGRIKFLSDEDGCSYSCSPKIQEIMKLEFKDGRRDKVTNQDHFDAELRYYVAANYCWEFYGTQQSVDLKTYGQDQGNAVY